MLLGFYFSTGHLSYRCVIVPHIGSATLETRREMAIRVAENAIAAILGGEMPSEIDLSLLR